jgi:hypothetical protein
MTNLRPKKWERTDKTATLLVCIRMGSGSNLSSEHRLNWLRFFVFILSLSRQISAECLEELRLLTSTSFPRQGLAPSIGSEQVFTWRRRQNPVSRTLFKKQQKRSIMHKDTILVYVNKQTKPKNTKHLCSSSHKQFTRYEGALHWQVHNVLFVLVMYSCSSLRWIRRVIIDRFRTHRDSVLLSYQYICFTVQWRNYKHDRLSENSLL